MAKHKGPDKFHVGQKVILVLHKSSEWERANGEPGVVIGPKCAGSFRCAPLDGPGNVEYLHGERYSVRWSGGVAMFEEYQLRAAYDGEQLSTWESFANVTGLDLAGACLVAMPVRRRVKA